MAETVKIGVFIIAFAFAVLMLVWAVWLNVRNNATSKFRQSLIDFAFQETPGWEERVDWYRRQPSYERMCPSSFFGPFTAKPLRQMIGGEYEEEFWRWKNGS